MPARPPRFSPARVCIRSQLASRQLEVARIRFDDTSLHEYLRATPVHARELALRMAEGVSPRRLVLEGACEASLVEDIVCDLSSRGVVIGIESEEGYDLLGPAIHELARQGDSRAAFAPRTQTPIPASAEQVRSEVVHEELTHAELFGDENEDVSPTACAVDAAPFCQSPESPASATSLEDAVMREVNHRSSVPGDVLESSSERSSVDKVLVEPSELKQRLSPLPPRGRRRGELVARGHALARRDPGDGRGHRHRRHVVRRP